MQQFGKIMREGENDDIRDFSQVILDFHAKLEKYLYLIANNFIYLLRKPPKLQHSYITEL